MKNNIFLMDSVQGNHSASVNLSPLEHLKMANKFVGRIFICQIYIFFFSFLFFFAFKKNSFYFLAQAINLVDSMSSSMID